MEGAVKVAVAANVRFDAVAVFKKYGLRKNTEGNVTHRLSWRRRCTSVMRPAPADWALDGAIHSISS
jgi:hypothetical protein